jgi:hypothetical protein
MKITMLTIAAGPQGSYQPGQILEVGTEIPKEMAQAFVDGGFARLTEKARPAAPVPEAAVVVETAVVEPVAEKMVKKLVRRQIASARPSKKG